MVRYIIQFKGGEVLADNADDKYTVSDKFLILYKPDQSTNVYDSLSKRVLYEVPLENILWFKVEDEVTDGN